MATLERRVQVLFDPAQYAALEQEAAAQHQSVAAVIRSAVDDRLRSRRTDARAALARLLESGDVHPTPGDIDWNSEKDAFERDLG
jgi:hypothetical protein